MSVTIEDLINVLNEYDHSIEVEEIVITNDSINIITDTSYCSYDIEYVKNGIERRK